MVELQTARLFKFSVRRLSAVGQASLPVLESLRIVHVSPRGPVLVHYSGYNKWYQLSLSLDPQSLPEYWYCKTNVCDT